MAAVRDLPNVTRQEVTVRARHRFLFAHGNCPLKLILLALFLSHFYSCRDQCRRVQSGACNAPSYLHYCCFSLPSFTHGLSSGKENHFQFPSPLSDLPESSLSKISDRCS